MLYESRPIGVLCYEVLSVVYSKGWQIVYQIMFGLLSFYFFQSRLSEILKPTHPLSILSKNIDWIGIEKDVQTLLDA